MPKKSDEGNITKIELEPTLILKKELLIDREQVQTNGQFYINAFYKGDMVTQYKIIEGMYNK